MQCSTRQRLTRPSASNARPRPPSADSTISQVMDTWEQLRRVKNYEEVAGVRLFQKLFVKSPQTKILFGFPINVDVSDPEVLGGRRFIMHAAYLIQMLDTALNMLGPDIELLTEIMLDLGSKHVRYGGTTWTTGNTMRCSSSDKSNSINLCLRSTRSETRDVPHHGGVPSPDLGGYAGQGDHDGVRCSGMAGDLRRTLRGHDQGSEGEPAVQQGIRPDDSLPRPGEAQIRHSTLFLYTILHHIHSASTQELNLRYLRCFGLM